MGKIKCIFYLFVDWWIDGFINSLIEFWLILDRNFSDETFLKGMVFYQCYHWVICWILVKQVSIICPQLLLVNCLDWERMFFFQIPPYGTLVLPDLGDRYKEYLFTRQWEISFRYARLLSYMIWKKLAEKQMEYGPM